LAQNRKQALTAANTAELLLESPEFLQELKLLAEASGTDIEKASKYSRKCLREIAATPTDSAFRPAARLARFIYKRSYEAELDINREALEELRELSKDNLLLFLWSHKSHMDSFVFLLSLYDNDYRPLPLVFAGANMNFLGFGALARRVGAIFLRRSFQDDDIYKLVFRYYIDYLIRNRIALTWSIEGTRSRTGKLSPPKLGILNWVLEACEREDMRDVKLVPVSIAFDRIAEIDDYVALQKGMPKRKESLRWFLDFIFGMKEPYGKIYVRYAEPVALEDAPTLSSSSDRDDGASLATRLAFEVCTRIEQVTPIKSADVLSMVLLAADGRALDREEIYQQARLLTAVVTERGLPTATGFSLDDEEQTSAAVLAMINADLVRRFDGGDRPVFYIADEQQLAAAYYRNTVTHFFLAAALGEIGLALCAGDIELPNEKNLRDQVEKLRDLFKFEFFFLPKPEFWEAVLRETRHHYPGWDSGTVSLHKQLIQSPPRFGHAMLRSLAEAYRVMAVSLLKLEGAPVGEHKQLTATMLGHGREMQLRRKISSASALSRDLFTTGLLLAEHRGLLEGPTDVLAKRRRLFAEETAQLLAAINLLQSSYDDAWFTPTAPDSTG
jgi:glycerol-3-phosphate O-acyltransferase